MKKAASIVLTITSAIVLTGCATGPFAPFRPPIGMLYTDIKAPVDIDFQENDLGTKSGSATSTNLLGLVATGDAGIQEAAENGGIRVIKHVDYKYTNILFGLMQSTTIIVYGD